MTLKIALLLCLLAGVLGKTSYKICTPAQHLKACEEMLEVETKSKVALECVPARDRMECLNFVQQRQADFVPVDPEDMYIASKMPNQDFVVFQEYRTDEEPDAEFRYEAVIVIHKDLQIDNLDQLKGLKSCHTGVNRNVGYKIPLTMMMKRAIFPKMNDHSISPKENELRALSTFFTKSCIVGKWSPDPKTNAAWKKQYSQLCALCEHPEICDYPDNYSGYEGALRCLAHNGGEVAFTKVIYVRKFFGLPVGTTPASPSTENPNEFAYLCADGSKIPVSNNKPCSWAARPWQGLMGHNDVLAKLSPLREKMRQLADAGAVSKSEWFTKVLGLSDKIHHVAENIPIKPADYLKKANYTEVIERGHGAPEPLVRMCVTSPVAEEKCRALSVFAFSRDIRPKLDCVQEATDADCLKSVLDNGSDLASVDGMKVASTANKYNLHPVFQEVYGDKKTPNYAVAVVAKNGQINKFQDLLGKKYCQDFHDTFSARDAPLYKHQEYATGGNPNNECADRSNFGVTINDQCNSGRRRRDMAATCSVRSSGQKCLDDGNGDVAFTSSATLSNYDTSKYELLCLNRKDGGRDALDKYETCNLAIVPSRTWVSAKDSIADVSIAHPMLSLAELLQDRTDLFNIYGEFLKNNNVLFNNAATGLATTDQIDFELLKSIHDFTTRCIS